MLRRIAIALAAGGIMTAGPVCAQTVSRMTVSPPIAPDASYRAIASGDLARAETALLRARSHRPDAPEIALNLAAVYAMTGRPGEAAPLYAQVLGEPAIAMDMPSGTVVSSHDVARRGEARLRQFASTR